MSKGSGTERGSAQGGPPAGLCAARRRDGQSCRAKAGASGYCFGHDPELQSRHEAGRRAGGKGRATAARVRKLLSGDGDRGDVLRLLKASLAETYRGELDPKAAGALASLSNALVRLYETGELELRLKALEEREE